MKNLKTLTPSRIADRPGPCMASKRDDRLREDKRDPLVALEPKSNDVERRPGPPKKLPVKVVQVLRSQWGAKVVAKALVDVLKHVTRAGLIGAFVVLAKLVGWPTPAVVHRAPTQQSGWTLSVKLSEGSEAITEREVTMKYKVTCITMPIYGLEHIAGIGRIACGTLTVEQAITKMDGSDKFYFVASGSAARTTCTRSSGNGLPAIVTRPSDRRQPPAPATLKP
jgi:hypothetical protein